MEENLRKNIETIDLRNERIVVVKYNTTPVKFLKVHNAEELESAVKAFKLHNSLHNIIDAPVEVSFLALTGEKGTLFYKEEEGFVSDGPLLELLFRETAHFFFIFQMLVASNHMDKWLEFIDDDEVRDLWEKLREDEV